MSATSVVVVVISIFGYFTNLRFCNHISGCNLPLGGTRWIVFGLDVEVRCPNHRSPRWWLVSDPCEPSSARELTTCANRQSCSVSNSTYMAEEVCTVCCANPDVSSLTRDAIFSCNNIGGEAVAIIHACTHT